jgi:GDPmannose 4,6-dehydratase
MTELPKPKAIIVGDQGQDGQYLSRLLLSRGYQVLGIGRSSARRLDSGAQLAGVMLGDKGQVRDVVAGFAPDEVYYLAASQMSSEGAGEVDTYGMQHDSLVVNQLGILNFLEAIRGCGQKTRFFFASSCLIFGARPEITPQDEKTPVKPDETYGWAKCIAGQMCADYRRRHGVKASVGILYNHDSPIRKPGYFSRKVINGVWQAMKDPGAKITVGNISAVNDWGFAGDFAEAFTRIIKVETPDDFIVATGQGHTIEAFLKCAYGAAGLDWRNHVAVDPKLLGRNKTGHIGNPAKLMGATGWKPSVTFEELVGLLVKPQGAGGTGLPGTGGP